MDLQRVKIVSDNDSHRTRCFVGENELHGVRGVGFKQTAGEFPQFEFDVFGLPDIETFGTVQFSFTPETVQQAAVILKHEFETNEKSCFALYDSVRSVLEESDVDRSIVKMLATKIGNRIFGLEEK